MHRVHALAREQLPATDVNASQHQNGHSGVEDRSGARRTKECHLRSAGSDDHRVVVIGGQVYVLHISETFKVKHLLCEKLRCVADEPAMRDAKPCGLWRRLRGGWPQVVAKQ